MPAEEWQSESWEAVDFPLMVYKNDQWERRNKTLSGLKLLFTREKLAAYKDYVIVVMPEIREKGFVRVRFREPGQGLLCLMQWIGSNYYKGRI